MKTTLLVTMLTLGALANSHGQTSNPPDRAAALDPKLSRAQATSDDFNSEHFVIGLGIVVGPSDAMHDKVTIRIKGLREGLQHSHEPIASEINEYGEAR